MVTDDEINQFAGSQSASKSMRDYNKASSMQLNWIELGKKHIKDAMELLQTPLSSLNIVDFACSHGKNSMSVINTAFNYIEIARRDILSNLKNITIYHNDLPDNDFEALDKCVNDNQIGYKNHSLICSSKLKLNTFCVGKSYYKQIVNENTIDYAFCFTSLHWMPSYLTLNYGLIHVNNNQDLELDEWANTLMDDCLKKWLELRYIELKQGGVLSFNIATSPHVHNLINEAWEKLLSNTNTKHEELDKVNIPVFNRALGQSEKVINSISEKFKLVKCEVMENWVQFTRSTFNTLFYNQIISGLSKYPQKFYDLESMEKFYIQLENELFAEGEFINIYFEFEWFLLQKL